MKYIFALIFTLSTAISFAQTKPAGKKSVKKQTVKPTVYEKPEMPPPPVPERHYDGLPAGPDPEYFAQKCKKAFAETDSAKQSKLLREMNVYAMAEARLADHLRIYDDTCKKAGQIPFRPDHFRRSFLDLGKSPLTYRETLITMQYEFDKQQYLKENAAAGNTNQIRTICNFHIKVDPTGEKALFFDWYGAECYRNDSWLK